MELGAFNINFKPHTTIKSQALVDFMAEWRENQIPMPASRLEHWIMYFDGSLKLDGGGACFLFISPNSEQLKYVLQILWEAEYEALLHGLRLTISLGIKRLLIYGDSKLVVQQVNKEWDCNKETMDDYVMEVRKLENKFAGLEIHHVIRDNMGVDVLSKLGSTRAKVPAGVFLQELHRLSIKKLEPAATDSAPPEPSWEVMMLEVDWRVDIVDYILIENLPANKTEAERIAWRSKGYVLVGSKLYKRRSTHEVHPSRRRKIPARRNPCRNLREPRCIKSSSREGIHIWILLAHIFGRC